MRKSRQVRSTARELSIEPGDEAYFSALRKHHALPSHYLYEVVKRIRKDRQYHIDRLRDLFDAGYLDRPIALNPRFAFSDHLCYALGDKVTGNELSRLPGGGYRHNFGTCIATANIDIFAARDGCAYISQEEILKASPNRSISISTNLSYRFPEGYTETSNAPTIPDNLFGIQYKSGRLNYLLEFDRGTETLRAKHFKTKDGQEINSVLKKLLAYKQMLIAGDAQKHFGTDQGFKVLFVTTSEERMKTMLELAGEIYPNGSHNICFTWVPGFNPYEKTPTLLPHLWNGPWKRAGKEDFYLSKP